MDLPITPILCKALVPLVGQVLTPELASWLVSQVAVRCYPGPVDTSGIEPQTVGSYVIRCVRAQEYLAALSDLHQEHWQETETHRHGVAFNPDYQRAIDLEAQGRYMLIVAFDSRTGAPVGNYGLYLARSMHTQSLTATEDTLFVSKPHRGGRLGVALIRYTERALTQLGVEELNVSVKQVNQVGQMIERMGYKPVGTQYTKILKEAAHVLA